MWARVWVCGALRPLAIPVRPHCPHYQLIVLCPQKPGILGDSPLGPLQPGAQSANHLLGELSTGNRPCPWSSLWAHPASLSLLGGTFPAAWPWASTLTFLGLSVCQLGTHLVGEPMSILGVDTRRGLAQCPAHSCSSAVHPGPSKCFRTLGRKGPVWATDILLSIGGGLPPELPPRRGKPPPLLPPLLGPSGGDREPMGLGPPAAQLTTPPAPVGLLGTGLRGLQKDSGPLPTPPGVRSCPGPSTVPVSCPAMFPVRNPLESSPLATGLTVGGAPQGLPDPPEPLPEPTQPAPCQQSGE